jgi:hypothetical protein
MFTRIGRPGAGLFACAALGLVAACSGARDSAAIAQSGATRADTARVREAYVTALDTLDTSTVRRSTTVRPASTG